MPRGLSSHQIKVVMLLNAVLLVLLCGVLFTVRSAGANVPTGGNGTNLPPHAPIRAARVSANPNIDWEINLGGTGNEQIVATFYAFNRLFIFGNCESKDLDFVGGKGFGFAAVLTAAGNTKAFITYDFTIVRALPAGRGFALLTQTDEKTVALKLLDSDCAEIGSAKTDANVSPQTALDLKIYDEHYFLVGNYHSQTLNRDSVVITVFDAALKRIAERNFSRAYSMTYLDLLPHGNGYLMAANVFSDMPTDKNHLMLSSFSLTTEPVNTNLNLQYAYSACAVTPYQDGYAALIMSDGKPEILTVDSLLSAKTTKHLGVETCLDADMFFLDGHFYVFMNFSPQSSQVMRFDLALNQSAEENSLNDLSALFDTVKSNRARYFLGGSADAFKLLAQSKVDDTVQQIRFGSKTETNGRLIPLSDGLLCVGLSAGKSRDVGGNFGGTDVWVTKLVL